MGTLPATLAEALRIKQGDTFKLVIRVNDKSGNPLDLSDREACMQLRNRHSSPVALELSTANGMIEIDGNKISLRIDHEDTAELSPSGRYMFDLQTTYADVVETLLSGRIEMIADVTYDCGN